MSTKKYISGKLQLVDGTQGLGKVLTSDADGLTSWSPKTIEILYADLYMGLTSSTLVKDSIYYITDRKIWIKALDTNLLSATGQRKMTIVRDEAYRSTLPNTYGVWKESGTYSIGDKVVWGVTVWENLDGNVGYWDYGDGDYNWTVSTELGPVESWVKISATNSTYYTDKIFEVKYDIIADFVYSQSDDRGNVIYPQDPDSNGYEPLPIEKTDWGDSLITNNINNGPILNNIGVVSNNVFCGMIWGNISRVIGNSNITGIWRNISVATAWYTGIQFNDLSNSSTYGITANTLFIAIKYNSNKGEINNNHLNGYISNNSNNGQIYLNSGTGSITYNSNNGSINSNIMGGVDTSSLPTGPSISKNSNNGSIYGNTIFPLGDNSEYIMYNSNNGNINNNTQLSGNTYILYNNNNGNITGARTGNVMGTIVNI